jgi:hypothetical protein
MVPYPIGDPPMRRPTRPTLALAAAAALAAPALGGEPSFRKHEINRTSIFEAAGALDVDGDGDLDIVSGGTWYEAPSWAPHKVRDVEQVGTYMNCFSTVPLDADGDGDTDFVSVSYFGKNVGWVENPGKGDAAWTYHEIDQPGPSECAVAVDLTGDGKPEILPNTVNTVVFYAHEVDGGRPRFRKVALGDTGAGHGIGSGDINRDGRVDILTLHGWFEAPAEPLGETWTFHKAWDLGATGIQILGRDLDGDGDTDLVYGMGHDIGLYWLEQARKADGSTEWVKHEVDREVSSVHTLLWADLDGDGEDDELITGKRVYAHEVEPGDVDPSIVAYYRFDPARKGFQRFVISKSGPARDAPPPDSGKRDAQKDFPPGTVGTGLEVAAVDIDADGDIDLVCPGKSGLYLLENLGTK